MIGNNAAARFSDYVTNLPTDFVDPASGFTRADGLALAQFVDGARALVVAPPLAVGSWNGGH